MEQHTSSAGAGEPVGGVMVAVGVGVVALDEDRRKIASGKVQVEEQGLGHRQMSLGAVRIVVDIADDSEPKGVGTSDAVVLVLVDVGTVVAAPNVGLLVGIVVAAAAPVAVLVVAGIAAAAVNGVVLAFAVVVSPSPASPTAGAPASPSRFAAPLIAVVGPPPSAASAAVSPSPPAPSADVAVAQVPSAAAASPLNSASRLQTIHCSHDKHFESAPQYDHRTH